MEQTCSQVEPQIRPDLKWKKHRKMAKMAKITPGHIVQQLWILVKTCAGIWLLDLFHTNPTFDLQKFKTYFNKYVSNTVLNSKQNVERALRSPCFKLLFVSLDGIQKLQMWNLKWKEAKSMQKYAKTEKRNQKRREKSQEAKLMERNINGNQGRT